jgi:signal transduction histidine kinase
MSAGSLKEDQVPGAREAPAEPGREGQAQAPSRVRQLYEISKLLTSFQRYEETIDAIVDLVSQALPLRSAIFIVEVVGRSRAMVWQGGDGDEEALRTAKAHALGAYSYLVRSGVDLEGPEAAPRALRGHPRKAIDDQTEGPSRFVLLPIVEDHHPIFGILQFETHATPQEDDVVFVNAVVNQLAVALDRQATIDERQASTEARKVAAEFREAQTEAERSWLKTVLDRMPAGVIIGEAPTGKLLLANRQAELIWGRPLALGAGIPEFREYLGFHPEDGRPYAPEEWPLARSIAAGEIVTEEEIEFFRRDGTRATLRVSSAPIEAPDRRIVSGVAIFYDVTQRKQADNAQRFLVEASALLASSLDYRHTLSAVVRLAVPALGDVCILDEVGEDGEVRRLEVAIAFPKQPDLAERVRLLAAGPDSQTPQSKVLESGQPLLLTDLADPVPQGTAESLEMLRAAGLRSMMVVPLLSRGEKLGTLTLARATPAGTYSSSDLAFAEEIARRAALAIDNARLYQHAQRATRARDDLIASVSHDLRSPLATIVGTADLLAQSEAPEEKRQRWVEALRRSADWMKRLIEDLVDIARIEAGRFTIEEERCAVGALLGEAMALMQPLAQEKTLRLQSEVAGGDFDIRCDRTRILRILSNLIGNSIKFTPAGGSIAVRAEPADGKALFSVTDTGSGIEPEELPHIFERFWQARKTARLGAGLGLAIAQGIVEAHRGKIWAESDPGKGSTFFFTLPLADPEEGSSPGAPSPP